jgi:glycosyltransferase involved in cell wall biosynthesis
MKTIAILTPNLHQRDGITAHSINLITSWLEAGFCVHVFNLGRLRVEFEIELVGIESLETHLRSTVNHKSKKIPVKTFHIMVVQYAISTYWLRIFFLNKFLNSKQNFKFYLMCHEPAREILLLKNLGKCIYKNALAKSSKTFVFSSEALTCLNSLSETGVVKIPLEVPKRTRSIGSNARYPNFLLMGYYLKDKGFELGFQAFVDAFVETKVKITLTIVVSARQRFGSARIFARRDRKNLNEFRTSVLNFQNRFPGVVFWNDFLPTNELEKTLEKTDFLLLPYSKITNSGVAVNAKSKGLPVISSNLLPLLEAFGDSGNYVEDDSIKSWSKAIQEIITNPNWRVSRDKISKTVYSLARSQSLEKEPRVVVEE